MVWWDERQDADDKPAAKEVRAQEHDCVQHIVAAATGHRDQPMTPCAGWQTRRGWQTVSKGREGESASPLINPHPLANLPRRASRLRKGLA